MMSVIPSLRSKRRGSADMRRCHFKLTKLYSNIRHPCGQCSEGDNQPCSASGWGRGVDCWS